MSGHVTGRASWFAYVLECADGTLYTGIARDVAARLAQHEAGKGARYTRGRAPLRLLGSLPCDDQSEALRIERAIKALPRAAKLAVVAQMKRRPRATRTSLLARL